MNRAFLINDFFFIKNLEKVSSEFIRSEIILNKEHIIFTGHFPNMPIVPGVCMIQMIKEVLSYYIGKDLFLTYAESIKYHSIINPQIDGRFNLDIEFSEQDGTNIKIKSRIFIETKIFMKLTGTLKVIS